MTMTYTAQANSYPIAACKTAIRFAQQTMAMIHPDNCESERLVYEDCLAKIAAMQARIDYLQATHA
jgi:hypothetical protein